MNRKQRKAQEKENRRANSKKNFIYMGKAEIPVAQIEKNLDLKECDPDILELIEHRFQWQQDQVVRNIAFPNVLSLKAVNIWMRYVRCALILHHQMIRLLYVTLCIMWETLQICSMV